jgi:predicted transcriptional regulator
VSHLEATAARIATGQTMRQTILDLLAGGPATSRHIAAAIHLEYSSANHHLRKLEVAGLITRGQFTPGIGREWHLDRVRR